MPQFAKRFCFYLANALAGDREMLAHFFQRVLRAAGAKTETHLDHFFLARSQCSQNLVGDLSKIGSDNGISRIENGLVLDKVAQM